jgi:hypothetical protein
MKEAVLFLTKEDLPFFLLTQRSDQDPRSIQATSIP